MTQLSSYELFTTSTQRADAPACADDDGSACHQIWESTHQGWLAALTDWLLGYPLAIIAILIGAVILRWIFHRLIRRIENSTAEGRVPFVSGNGNGSAMFAEATGLKAERRTQRASAIGSILRSVSTAVIFTVAFMLVIDKLGFNLAPVLASAGIAGVALGFGAQTLVKDILSGVAMLIEDQYGVGDVIDMGDAIGTVEGVGLRVTKLRDIHGAVWYVRNGEVLRVGNMSQGWARVAIDVPLPFGTQLEHVSGVIERAVTQFCEGEDQKENILEAPSVWGVEQMTTTGLLLRVTVKVVPGTQWEIGRKMRGVISETLDTEEVSYGIPVELTVPK